MGNSVSKLHRIKAGNTILGTALRNTARTEVVCCASVAKVQVYIFEMEDGSVLETRQGQDVSSFH